MPNYFVDVDKREYQRRYLEAFATKRGAQFTAAMRMIESQLETSPSSCGWPLDYGSRLNLRATTEDGIHVVFEIKSNDVVKIHKIYIGPIPGYLLNNKSRRP